MQFITQQATQLILGGNHGNARTGILEGLENRRRAQQLGFIHHYFAIVFAVVVKITANTVHHRSYAGDDGNIIGIGETRHHAIGA